jgi:hypothetical protein
MLPVVIFLYQIMFWYGLLHKGECLFCIRHCGNGWPCCLNMNMNYMKLDTAMIGIIRHRGSIYEDCS